MEYEVKITGSGTPEEIVKSLKSIISDIEAGALADEVESEWEDPTLMAVITEAD